jgi:superfamily II DNA/RNA helicase
MQARVLAGMATGADLVVNAATGSGKGLLLSLPAASAWHSTEPGALAPIDLVIVPYKALGMHHEKTFNALFQQLAKEGKMRPGACALFVRRGQCADLPATCSERW